MAFALSKARFYQLQQTSPVNRPNLQVLEFDITRANTDTALDLFSVSGTFWTAAGASGLGAKALSALELIASQVAHIVSCQVVGNNAVLAPVSASAGALTYILGNAGTFPVVQPSITLASGSGAVSLKVCLVVALKDGVSPVDFT